MRVRSASSRCCSCKARSSAVHRRPIVSIWLAAASSMRGGARLARTVRRIRERTARTTSSRAPRRNPRKLGRVLDDDEVGSTPRNPVVHVPPHALLTRGLNQIVVPEPAVDLGARPLPAVPIPPEAAWQPRHRHPGAPTQRAGLRTQQVGGDSAQRARQDASGDRTTPCCIDIAQNRRLPLRQEDGKRVLAQHPPGQHLLRRPRLLRGRHFLRRVPVVEAELRLPSQSRRPGRQPLPLAVDQRVQGIEEQCPHAGVERTRAARTRKIVQDGDKETLRLSRPGAARHHDRTRLAFEQRSPGRNLMDVWASTSRKPKFTEFRGRFVHRPNQVRLEKLTGEVGHRFPACPPGEGRLEDRFGQKAPLVARRSIQDGSHVTPKRPRRQSKLVERRPRSASTEVPTERRETELLHLQAEYSCHGIASAIVVHSAVSNQSESKALKLRSPNTRDCEVGSPSREFRAATAGAQHTARRNPATSSRGQAVRCAGERFAM